MNIIPITEQVRPCYLCQDSSPDAFTCYRWGSYPGTRTRLERPPTGRCDVAGLHHSTEWKILQPPS